MRQLVDQHQPVAADQHRDDAAVGEIAGAEHQRRLGLLDAGETRFQFGIKRMIAGDQARGTRAGAVNLQRLDGRLLDDRMLAQIEVVVAGKRQQALAAALDPDSVFAQGVGQRAAQVAAFEVGKLGLRKGVQRGHQVTLARDPEKWEPVFG